MNPADPPAPPDDPAGPPDPPKHRRRVRYRGTHPRAFEEKYKELAAERYADDVAKVIAGGKTPAGTHRPICVAEILAALDPRPGQTGLDATLGYGGHARELLERIRPGGRLFALDVDPIERARTEARLRGAGFGEDELTVVGMNFAGIPKLLDRAGGGFDFLLADLGISSMQLDNPARGFTYKREGPLDLRLNPERGIPAAEWLRQGTEASLEKILRAHADEPNAREIAKALFERRNDLATTTALAGAVRDALATLRRPLPDEAVTTAIRRTFQAIRIAVNDEFSALSALLAALPGCLNPGGRAAILSFHSGEDARVARAFEQGRAAGLYASVSESPIRPSPRERFENPRSKAALLRVAVRS